MAIYSNVITVSEQSWSVAVILSNKMDFKFCAYMVDFLLPSHNIIIIMVCTVIKSSYTLVCNPLYFPVIHMFYIGVVYPTYTLLA